MVKSNKTLLLFFSLLAISFVFHNCKKDDENSSGNPVPLGSITNLMVADIGNAGNGTDLQISFTKVADETNVKAYQIFVVNSSEGAEFNLEKAQGISVNNLFTIDKTGNDLTTTLSANSKTTTGASITNDQPYTIFVMTLSTDLLSYSNNLGSPGFEITLTDSGANTGSVAAVSNLLVEDIANAGNGTDLQLSFSKVADEAIVQEYRAFVVAASQSGDFDLAAAESITENNSFTIEKTGSNISTTLSSDTKTTTGDLLTNDTPYQLFIMTVAADPIAHENALSTASEEITLVADALVTVTYIANDGIMIEFEGKKVVIDAINRTSNLGGWVSPSNTALMAVENGDPPYDDIDVIMITHNHGDHYSTTAVSNYLGNHPNTKLIVPSVMESSFSAYASQIADFNVAKYERISIVENDINISVLHIEHFDQFGNDFSGVESFAYVVNFGEKAFFHGGDIDYVDSNLSVFNLLDDNITAAFIPTFGDLVSATNRDAIIDNINPENIVCLHFLTSTLNTTLNQVNTIYPGATVFTTPFQTVTY